jgi:acyl-CoA synthetase (AMP-forming)/AMP-acid ligase II
MSWATGNAAVIDAGESSAETILAALMTCRPVSLSLLVTTVRSIARAPNYSVDAIKSVRFVDLVGSTVTMAILRTAQLTFPGARILPTFAMTEAVGTVTWAAWHRPPSVHKMPAWHGIASSGTVAPGAALKVVDADKKVAHRGDVGALHLRGNSVISSYLGGTSRPDAFYTGEDGRQWFVSGDDAVIDKQGFLYVLGRSQYTLKRDDKVIVPCTIEDFLETQFQDTTVSNTLSPGHASDFKTQHRVLTRSFFCHDRLL